MMRTYTARQLLSFTGHSSGITPGWAGSSNEKLTGQMEQDFTDNAQQQCQRTARPAESSMVGLYHPSTYLVHFLHQ